MNSRCDSCLVTSIYLLSATLMREILLYSSSAQTMSIVNKEVDIFIQNATNPDVFRSYYILQKNEHTNSSQKVYEQFTNSIVEMITNKKIFRLLGFKKK